MPATRLNKTWFTLRLRRMLESAILDTTRQVTHYDGEPFYATDARRLYVGTGTSVELYPSLNDAMVDRTSGNILTDRDTGTPIYNRYALSIATMLERTLGQVMVERGTNKSMMQRG